jgi:hypothetical protein
MVAFCWPCLLLELGKAKAVWNTFDECLSKEVGFENNSKTVCKTLLENSFLKDELPWSVSSMFRGTLNG